MSTTNSSSLPGVTREQAYVAGLRSLADFLDENPQLVPDAELGISKYADGRDELARLARQVSGRWDKQADDASAFFRLARHYGPHQFALIARREAVCERVVIGVERVTKSVPDPEMVAKLPTLTVTEDVERVEWRCEPSLLAGTEAES